MRKHKGMRPHDIVVLLKIAANRNESWLMKDLAYELSISQSEISESLHRSMYAGLITGDKKSLMKHSLIDFLFYGIRYVFPQQPGELIRGMPTAHSAFPLSDIIKGNDIYVWPLVDGPIKGQRIDPLHPSVPKSCQKDKNLYQMLALVDALRIGKQRERVIAIDVLKKLI